MTLLSRIWLMIGLGCRCTVQVAQQESCQSNKVVAPAAGASSVLLAQVHAQTFSEAQAFFEPPPAAPAQPQGPPPASPLGKPPQQVPAQPMLTPKAHPLLLQQKANESRGIEVVMDNQIGPALARARNDVAAYLAHLPKGSTLVSYRRTQATVVLAMLASKLNGDFAETGVYKGGTSILMAKVMLANNDASRQLWAADSFQGLPPEDVNSELAARKEESSEKLPNVRTRNEGVAGQFSSSRQVFEKNLAASGLGGNTRIKVLQGWFNETLPAAPIQKLAFLRLDGDLYVSTMDALKALYDKVVPGGYIYVDDYGSYAGCRDAVNQFLRHRGEAVQLHAIREDDRKFEAVWWQKA